MTVLEMVGERFKGFFFKPENAGTRYARSSSKRRDCFISFSRSDWQLTQSRVKGSASRRPGAMSDSQLSQMP